MKPAPYRDGWMAHLRGFGVDQNPYREDAQEYSHHQWTSGWCDRFNSCKHTRVDLMEQYDDLGYEGT